MKILKQVNDAFKRWERTPKYQRVLILTSIGLILIGIPLFGAINGFIEGRELILNSESLNLTTEEEFWIANQGVIVILFSLALLAISLKLIQITIKYWYVIKNLINK